LKKRQNRFYLEAWAGGRGRGQGQGGEMAQTMYAHMNKRKFLKMFKENI
jgi:hypothetical protein